MSLTKEMIELRCVRYDALPDLALYMDQVLSLLEKQLSPFAIEPGEKLITSTMINNYVKTHLIPPPEKKRYTKDHLAQLFICALLKQVLTLSELETMLDTLRREHTVAQTYDRFCEELETAMHAVFGGDHHLLMLSENSTRSFLRATATAYALQLYSRETVSRYRQSMDPVEEVKVEKKKKKKTEEAEER